MRRLAPIVLLLALVGCDRRPTTDVPDGAVTLRVRDFRYDHQTVRVPVGRITFDVRNAGREETNFRLRRGDRELLSVSTIEPGASGTASIRLPAGRYTMYSSVGRHEELGEYGELIVSR